MNYLNPITNLISTKNTPPEQTLENRDPLSDSERSHMDDDFECVGTTPQEKINTLREENKEYREEKIRLQRALSMLVSQLGQTQSTLKEKDRQLDTLREIAYPLAERSDSLKCTNAKFFKLFANLHPNKESLSISYEQLLDSLEGLSPSLKHLTIFSKLPSKKRDEIQKKLKGIRALDLSELPPQLQTLKLVNCPTLFSLNGLSSFTNLTKLVVDNCPITTLYKLPSQLKSLKIDNCHKYYRNENIFGQVLLTDGFKVDFNSLPNDLEQLYVTTTDTYFTNRFKTPPPNLKILYMSGKLTDNDRLKDYLKEGLECLIIIGSSYVDNEIVDLLPKSLRILGFLNCPNITGNRFDKLPENLEMLIHCNSDGKERFNNNPLLSRQVVTGLRTLRKNIKFTSDFREIRKIQKLFAVDEAISLPVEDLANEKNMSPPPSSPTFTPTFSDFICEWFNELDRQEQQKEPDKEALIEIRTGIETLWDKYESTRNQHESSELDPIFINLIQRVAKLHHVPAEGHSFEGQCILGTYNQFSPIDRNGQSWPADSSRASCTVNALNFLSQILRINSIEDWKQKASENAESENIVNCIIDEGRAHFDQIAQCRRKEHDALIEKAEKNNEYDTVKYLKFQQAGDSLHVSEVPDVEEKFAFAPPNHLPTATLFKDKEGNTTTTFFEGKLKMLKNQEKNKLGAIITCNGYSYAIAMIQQRENTEFIIFDSHGSTRVNPHNQAFIFSTTNLKECARFLGTLIPFDDALKEREHTNKVSITVIEAINNK